MLRPASCLRQTRLMKHRSTSAAYLASHPQSICGQTIAPSKWTRPMITTSFESKFDLSSLLHAQSSPCQQRTSCQRAPMAREYFSGVYLLVADHCAARTSRFTSSLPTNTPSTLHCTYRGGLNSSIRKLQLEFLCCEVYIAFPIPNPNPSPSSDPPSLSMLTM